MLTSSCNGGVVIRDVKRKNRSFGAQPATSQPVRVDLVASTALVGDADRMFASGTSAPALAPFMRVDLRVAAEAHIAA